MSVGGVVGVLVQFLVGQYFSERNELRVLRAPKFDD
jgi:hypothetical protein